MTETPDTVIGRTPDGWLTVSLALRQMEGERQTINHDTVTDAEEFAASGMIVRQYRSGDCDSAGQMLDELLNVTRFVGPWTREDALELHRVWQRWHLNGMKAGCAHMPAGWTYPQGQDEESRRRWEERPTCPETGYRWGSAWLYEAITPEDRAVIARLMDLAAASRRWTIGVGPVDR